MIVNITKLWKKPSILLILNLIIFHPLSYAETNNTKKSVASAKKPMHIAPPSTPLSATGEQLKSIEQLAGRNLQQAKQLAQTFDGTPLSSIAHYHWLQSVVTDSSYQTDLVGYLLTQPNTYWSHQLASRWIEHLETKQDWIQLISYQDILPKQGNNGCVLLTAQLMTGFMNQNDWTNEVSSRWLQQKKTSTSCKTLFDKLETSQYLTTDQWQQKLTDWYENGQIETAQKKQSLIPVALQAQNQEMTQLLSGNLQENAKKLFSLYSVNELNMSKARLILTAIAKTNPEQALIIWNEHKDKLNLTLDHQLRFEKELFTQLAKSQPENKLMWLANINPALHDESTLSPLLTNAIGQSDWKTIIQLTDQLARDLQQDIWHYWRAKAFYQTNQYPLAQPILEKLSLQRSYYGFLAADLLGKNYQLNSIQVSAEQLDNAHKSALGQRIQALYEVGLKDMAWKEWQFARNHQIVTQQEVPGFAQLAQSLGWHSFAVLSLGKPEHWNYTQLRFAMPYQDLVRPKATQHDISLAWTYGIIRRESAYAQDAKSSAGAMGLMQLMPKTAKALAPIQQLKDVYEPELNVHLGTKLLGQLKKEFNGNILLATASYNAGGFRVRQWLKQNPDLTPEQWIELIPFKETRDYVKAVLEYMLVFERKGLVEEQTRLSDYLKPFNHQLAASTKTCNPEVEWCL